MITELSELCGLFQRMGRCYRKRNYEGKKPNVYVFDGGDKPTSGIHESKQEYDDKKYHSVVDYHLFKISKEAIAQVNGYLAESDKLKLIDKNYTTDKLLDVNCQLIDKVNGCIDYLDDLTFLDNPKTKDEVINNFRNINTIDIIPEKVFRENKAKIEAAAETLNSYIKKEDFSDQTEYRKQHRILVKEKIKAREIINNYLVGVPLYINIEVSKSTDRWIKNEALNKAGYQILPADFNYDSMTGLSYNGNKNINTEIDDDNMF